MATTNKQQTEEQVIVPQPAPTPTHGGRYTEQADGSLVLVERTKTKDEE